jgi:hypothetical protein
MDSFDSQLRIIIHVFQQDCVPSCLNSQSGLRDFVSSEVTICYSKTEIFMKNEVDVCYKN